MGMFSSQQMNEMVAVDLNNAFEECVVPGVRESRSFEEALYGINRAFSERSVLLGNAIDTNVALAFFEDLQVIPELVVDARGEEGLDFALQLEERVRSVGVRHIFDRNTLEI